MNEFSSEYKKFEQKETVELDFHRFQSRLENWIRLAVSFNLDEYCFFSTENFKNHINQEETNLNSAILNSFPEKIQISNQDNTNKKQSSKTVSYFLAVDAEGVFIPNKNLTFGNDSDLSVLSDSQSQLMKNEGSSSISNAFFSQNRWKIPLIFCLETSVLFPILDRMLGGEGDEVFPLFEKTENLSCEIPETRLISKIANEFWSCLFIDVLSKNINSSFSLNPFQFRMLFDKKNSRDFFRQTEKYRFIFSENCSLEFDEWAFLSFSLKFQQAQGTLSVLFPSIFIPPNSSISNVSSVQNDFLIRQNLNQNNTLPSQKNISKNNNYSNAKSNLETLPLSGSVLGRQAEQLFQISPSKQQTDELLPSAKNRVQNQSVSSIDPNTNISKPVQNNILETESSIISSESLSNFFSSQTEFVDQENSADKAHLSNQKEQRVDSNIFSDSSKASVDVVGKIGTAMIDLSDLLQLKVGDILETSLPVSPFITLEADEKPYFLGRLGLSDDQPAIRLIQKLDSSSLIKKTIEE